MRIEMYSSETFINKRAFEAIDEWQSGFIDKKNLKSFLRRQNYIASTAECLAIIRRLDLDADARLSIKEFITGLTPFDPPQKSAKKA